MGIKFSSVQFSRSVVSDSLRPHESQHARPLEKTLDLPTPQIFHSYACVLCLASQSCPTLCDPMDCSPPGSSVHGWRFSRQEYWSGLPCPPPGDLPNPGIEPRSPELQADSLPSEPPGKPMSTPYFRKILRSFGGTTILHTLYST